MSVNPLDFDYEHQRIGGDIGFSSVWQTGTYLVGCGKFDEGAKLNPVIALSYDRPLASGIRLEGMLGFQTRSVNSSYHERERTVITSAEGNIYQADIDYEHVGSARFGYIFLMPSVRFSPVKGIFLGAGLDAAFLVSSSVQYTRNILSKSITVPGNILPIQPHYEDSESSDPWSKVYEPEEPTAAGFALDGVLYVGGDFPVSKKMDLLPRVLFTLPVTTVLSNPDLKLSSLQFLVGLRYNLY